MATCRPALRLRQRANWLTIAARPALVIALIGGAAASYTVSPGDTLSGIAARHGLSVDELAALNGLGDPNRIFAGQTLALPGSVGSPASTGDASHTVGLGDTLSGIAVRYGVGVGDIAAANGLSDPDRIVSGQRLIIPGAASSASTAAPSPRAAARGDVEALLTSTAQRYGWSTAFVKAVAWQESGWSNTVVSSQGAIGIMQVLPETGEFASRHLVGRPLDLNDPADNVEAGVAFLDHLHALTGGDARKILAGYYQGLRSVERNGVYPSTERYIENVLALRDRFR
ncbi:MAG TPA: LysM peptidoglycan-binding domain-containing protein [Egibacteraceae bacterium]|nr:LysM peptidoglycan-binding domain-containing protein [Egibacteraceae bacterium]